MVGRRKILLRLLHPEGYTGCTADTIIKKAFYFILSTKSKQTKQQLRYKHLARADMAAYKKIHDSPNLHTLPLFFFKLSGSIVLDL